MILDKILVLAAVACRRAQTSNFRARLLTASLIIGMFALLLPAGQARAQSSPHGDLKIACEYCHNPGSWKDISPSTMKFKHSKTKFPLVGQHGQVPCQQCHGPVETMDRVRQFETLAMGWCVNCHRGVNAAGLNNRKMNAPTDCSGCHF